MALLGDLGVNLRDSLCDILTYAAQSLDFLELTQLRQSFKLICVQNEFSDEYYLL